MNRIKLHKYHLANSNLRHSGLVKNYFGTAHSFNYNVSFLCNELNRTKGLIIEQNSLSILIFNSLNLLLTIAMARSIEML